MSGGNLIALCHYPWINCHVPVQCSLCCPTNYSVLFDTQCQCWLTAAPPEIHITGYWANKCYYVDNTCAPCSRAIHQSTLLWHWQTDRPLVIVSYISDTWTFARVTIITESYSGISDTKFRHPLSWFCTSRNTRPQDDLLFVGHERAIPTSPEPDIVG